MNNFLQKSLTYIIYILLFSSFFLFSHILYIFGIEKDITLFGIGGFEGIKSIVLIFSGILSFVFLLLYNDKNSEKNNILWLYCGIIILTIIISSIFSMGSGNFFLGSSEKHHGGLYYISLVIIFLALAVGYRKIDYYKTLNIIFIFFVILGFYGVIQKLGYDPLFDLYQTRVSLSRVFSTLGNANYLAGLSIILLPLTQIIKNIYYKYFLFLFCLLILLLTGSYFGAILALVYMLYKLYKINIKLFLGGVLIFISLIGFTFHNITVEKLGSMKARPYIWISSISAIIESPKTFFTGNGPDTLQQVFHKHKHEKLNIYETSSYTADRSHNIFLDLIYFFGILGGGFIIFSLLYSLKISNNTYVSESIILFLIFFSFNIPVSIHFLILVVLLAEIYQNKGIIK